MINKNKEEIEKIKKGCNKYYATNGQGIKYYCGKKINILCPVCKKIKQERIKTSIPWCEDEIEDWKWISLTANELRIKNYGTKKLQQLQTHLTYLKEQEKEL